MFKKVQLVLLVVGLLINLNSDAQNVEQQEFAGILVPQYMGSGTSTRIPTTFYARIDNLTPGTKYKYYIKAVTSSDFGTTTTGEGNTLFINDSSSWKYVTSPSFSAGKHDTFYARDGFVEQWFSFIYTGNTMFTAGNKVYPLLIIETLSGTEKRRLALNDSIHVLSYSTSSGSNNGTGIHGRSLGDAKKFVAVYTEDGSDRPLTISHIENDSVSIASSVGYWNTKVNGIDGAWGGVTPNTLDSGVRRIKYLDISNNQVYEHVNKDAKWGSVATINPNGGSTSPLFIDSFYAPFVAPQVDFKSSVVSRSESDTLIRVIIDKLFGNNNISKIKISIGGGSLSLGSDFEFDTSLVYDLKSKSQSSDTLYLKIKDDEYHESTENVILQMKPFDNCELKGTGYMSVTILDNDIAKYSFKKSAINVKEDVGRVDFGIYKENGHADFNQQVKVVLKSKGNLTLANEFYFGSKNDSLFTFQSGVLRDSQFARVKVIDDSKEDDNDTLVFALRTVSSVEIGADSLLVVVIENDDIIPVFTFEVAQSSIKESNDSFRFKVIRTKKNALFSDVKLSFVQGLSTAVNNFDFEFFPISRILSFTASSSDTLTLAVKIKEDQITESNEYIRFKLEPLTNSKIGLIPLFDLVILDDDHKFYKMKDLISLKSNGELDLLNEEVKVSGVVYGGNMRPLGSPEGFQFTLRDNTGGLQIFSPSGNFGYSVKEGDSITVQGVLGQFGGVAQIAFIDTIIKHSSNSYMKSANKVKSLSESVENDLVWLEEVTLLDPSEWPVAPLATNTFKDLRCSTETRELVIRIDSDTDIDGTVAPNTYFDVTGIGSQYDFSLPLDSNYILLPRNLSDVTNRADKVLSFDRDSQLVKEKWNDSTESITIKIGNITELTQVDLVKVGGTATAVLDYQYTLPRRINFTPGDTTYTFKIKIVNNGTSQSDKVLELGFKVLSYGVIVDKGRHLIRIKDDETSSISEFEKSMSLKVYPNPINDILIIESKLPYEKVSIYSMQGQKILESTSTTPIKTNGLESGFYMIELTYVGGQKILKKVVKK